MFKICFKSKINFNENHEYLGCVTDVKYDEVHHKIRIYVHVYDFPERSFYQSIKVDVAQHSDFANFCYRLNLVDDNGYVDESRLKDADVMVLLNRYNSDVYVRHIRYATKEEVDDYQSRKDTEEITKNDWNDCTGQEAVF